MMASVFCVQVENVELGKDEPLWSKNLKKGVVALFQVDLVKGRTNHPHAKAYHVQEVCSWTIVGSTTKLSAFPPNRPASGGTATHCTWWPKKRVTSRYVRSKTSRSVTTIH